MIFEAIASSSHGNAYLVSDGQSRILLECGLAFRTLQQAIGGVPGLSGCLVSHEHKDHARCAADIVRRGVPVYMSCGTALALELAELRQIEVVGAEGWRNDGGTDCHTSDVGHWLAMTKNGEQCSPLRGGRPMTAPTVLKEVYAVEGRGVELIAHGEHFQCGSFDVVPFNTFHDAKEPLGFAVRSRVDGEELVFATDTVNLRYKFPGVTILAIEANYELDRLRRSERMPDKVKERITNTHMEIDTLCDILRGMDLSSCRELWLLHLSDACSHEAYFINKVRRCVPASVKVMAAGR